MARPSIALFFVLMLLNCDDGPPQGTVAGDSPVWHYDDADAGVRCYVAKNHRWACVRIR